MTSDREVGEPPLTLYLVKRLELAIRAMMDDALRPLGVTTLQYTALTVLQHRGGLSSAQLARRSFLRPQTMNEMVLVMEQRGWITRKQSPHNRRVLLAELTEDGRRLLAECAPKVTHLESLLLDGMTAAQRARFRDSLRHGIAALSSAHP